MRLTLERNNLWCTAEGSEAELDRLDHLLRYRMGGYKFVPSYKAGQWDGWTRMCRWNKRGLEFPIGLWPYVVEQLQGIETVHDSRGVPPAPSLNMPASPGAELSVEQVRAATLALIHGSGIVQYPTGVGKGRVIGEVIRQVAVPTLVLVDKTDLMYQLKAEIAAVCGLGVRGIDGIGLIGDGKFDPQAITIATFQSMAKQIVDGTNIELGKKWDMVIVDEAHHAGAKQFRDVLSRVPAYYRLGFSGTPFRSFKQGKTENLETFLRVQAHLGPPIATMTIQEGVDSGRIVSPDLFVVQGCDWQEFYRIVAPPTVMAYDRQGSVKPKYAEEVEYGLVKNELRTQAIVRLARALQQTGPTVVLVERIEHGRYLQQRITENEIGKAKFVHGEMTQQERQHYYDMFKRGIIPCLIISKIGDESLDLPNIEHLILAGGGKAAHRQVQRIGRALRSTETKKSVMVFDFEDYGEHLGAHYRARRRSYEAEEAYHVIDIDFSELEEYWPL